MIRERGSTTFLISSLRVLPVTSAITLRRISPLGQYAKGDIHTNTIESSFALVKRGIIGTYHNVSKEYLHRYLWQFDFVWNTRKLNDGERTIAAIQSAEGKRLTYKAAPFHA
jgi:hypothetical protein